MSHLSLQCCSGASFDGAVAVRCGRVVRLGEKVRTFPWTYPRLRLVARRDDALPDKLVARLWAHTLVFDPRTFRIPYMAQRVHQWPPVDR
jgi:hypothetical protein